MPEDMGPFSTYTRPTKSMAAKVKPMIREAVDGVARRTARQLRLPNAVQVFRWELVGQATQLALREYQKPRLPADMELIDDLIGLAAEVLGRNDIATVTDTELLARLRNATRLHEMVHHYLDHLGASPAMEKLAGATTDILEGKAKLDPSAFGLLIVDAANQTAGPAMADIFAYRKKVHDKQEVFDWAHYLDLNVPVMNQFGAPPAVADYLRTSADRARRQVVADPTEEYVRTERMMANASRQLRMPSAIGEALDYMADVVGNLSRSHLLEKPEEVMKLLADLSSLQAKLNEQLQGPASISRLILRLSAPLRRESGPDAAEVIGLLAQTSREMSLPGGLADFLQYVSSVSANGGKQDLERLEEILLQLGEQMEAPEAMLRFVTKFTDLATKSDGLPNPDKFAKLVTQLFHGLDLHGFADVFAKVGAPLFTKGKVPDPLALAAVAPSFMRVLPDFATAEGLAGDMRRKILRPIRRAYTKAVRKLTGSMPESHLKTALKQGLLVARPLDFMVLDREHD